MHKAHVIVYFLVLRASQSLLNVHSRHCAATHKANVIVYFPVLRASQSLLNVHSRHCAATHKAHVIVYFLVLMASQSLLNVHSRHCAAMHKANVIVYFPVLRASQSLLNVHSHAQGSCNCVFPCPQSVTVLAERAQPRTRLIAAQSLMNVTSRHAKAHVIVCFLVLRASQSLLNVHSRHSAATHKAQKAGLGPISQLDMSLTQFGFMGYGLLYPRKLGLTGNEDDFEGFIHFWRTIGHVLGIEERSKRIVKFETPITSKDACSKPYANRMDARYSNEQILTLNVAKNTIREQMDLLIESSEKDQIKYTNFEMISHQGMEEACKLSRHHEDRLNENKTALDFLGPKLLRLEESFTIQQAAYN
uniref:ER-bound oxygenase mpaB/mpaB'/Rubber oxygenase catalytic domain-containing protein n=1 Tax=Timema douglasi TaxID=61478 RepID=A0A7R8VUE6_TIMDO|nr:unnamed protein product [Timema douglasi]